MTTHIHIHTGRGSSSYLHNHLETVVVNLQHLERHETTREYQLTYYYKVT